MLLDKLKARLPWRLRHLAERAEQWAGGQAARLVTRRRPLPRSVAERRVVLVGASVSRDWHLPLVFPNISTLCSYQFDKTEALEQALARRPDAVIIKECAAYFPPDRQQDRGLVQGWMDRLQDHGVRPVLATVAPVTKAHARSKPGRAEGLWAYNDWLRDLAQERGVALLDLEAALRVNAGERYLRDDLHSGDGLHLRRGAYRGRLDALIPPLLLRVFPPGDGGHG